LLSEKNLIFPLTCKYKQN